MLGPKPLTLGTFEESLYMRTVEIQLTFSIIITHSTTKK